MYGPTGRTLCAVGGAGSYQTLVMSLRLSSGSVVHRHLRGVRPDLRPRPHPPRPRVTLLGPTACATRPATDTAAVPSDRCETRPRGGDHGRRVAPGHGRREDRDMANRDVRVVAF